jgi:molybdate transport system permease protein
MDWEALRVSLMLGGGTVALLLPLGIWFGRLLAVREFRGKLLVEALVTVPLVLPPTVLGFYLLMAMGSRSPLGRWWTELTGHSLAFTFEGLVIASVLYSLPFAVQPVAAGFSQIDPSLREASATLGASGLRTFARVTLPLSIEGVIAGLVLSFAHTVGEFGVVLMVGGNLPGITRTVSISIYDHVQAIEYQRANQTALVLLAFSMLVLMAVYGLRRRPWAAAPIA